MSGDIRILSNYLYLYLQQGSVSFGSSQVSLIPYNQGEVCTLSFFAPGCASGRVVIDRTQQELADYFGVTRPSLARAIGEMEQEGLIKVDRREVRLMI
jgi:CRP-like cAMP-binding protein